MRKAGLKEIHVRLYADDVEKLKKMAARSRIPWNIELRQLVHRALDVQLVNPERGGQ